MEQFAYKDLTLLLFEKCCEAVDFPAGIAMQAYLRSGDDDARRIADWAKKTGRQVTVRLVKGAYWDYETIHAEEMGWPCPVWGAKSETGRLLRADERIFLDVDATLHPGEGGVKLALGSHNVRSIAAAFAGWSVATSRRRRSSCRCSTGWPTSSNTRRWTWACASASTCPSAR